LLIAVLQARVGLGVAHHLPQQLAQQIDEFVVMQLQTRQRVGAGLNLSSFSRSERACSS
jgi:hypothetical protein